MYMSTKRLIKVDASIGLNRAYLGFAPSTWNFYLIPEGDDNLKDCTYLGHVSDGWGEILSEALYQASRRKDMNFDFEHVHIMDLPFVDLRKSKIGFQAIANEFYLIPDSYENPNDAIYIGSANDPWEEIVKNAEIYDERIM